MLVCKCRLLKCALMGFANFAKFTEVVFHDGLNEKFEVKTFFFLLKHTTKNKIMDYLFRNKCFKRPSLKSC